MGFFFVLFVLKIATVSVIVVHYLPSLFSSNGNSSSWSSLGLEGEACEERMSFSPSDRSVSHWLSWLRF